MMDNWMINSAESKYDIAMRTGKDIWFESQHCSWKCKGDGIQNAIPEDTWLSVRIT
jgi:hypothetical protein